MFYENTIKSTVYTCILVCLIKGRKKDLVEMWEENTLGKIVIQF